MFKHAPWLLLLAAGLVHARYATVETKAVPIARIIKNLTAATTKTPSEWTTWLNLGRAHAMAAFLEKDEATVPSKSESDIWWGHQPSMLPFVRGVQSVRSDAHLAAALEAYRKADALHPQNPLILVGIGYLLEKSGKTQEAIETYRTALRLSWAEEKDQKYVMGGTKSGEIISYLKPLLDPRSDAAELADLDKSLTTISRMGRTVTPIAMPLEPGLTPSEVQRDSPVWFDADGSGFRRSWTWLQPSAGWLVFTPSGRVDSALQLFGSVTFWMFWRDGYAALSALDDDGDGALAGAELAGLSVWRDANANGLSEDGEVLPLASWGVVSISCRGEPGRQPGVQAASARGVTFTDGSTRPTWDLLLRRVEGVAGR